MHYITSVINWWHLVPKSVWTDYSTGRDFPWKALCTIMTPFNTSLASWTWWWAHFPSVVLWAATPCTQWVIYPIHAFNIIVPLNILWSDLWSGWPPVLLSISDFFQRRLLTIISLQDVVLFSNSFFCLMVFFVFSRVKCGSNCSFLDNSWCLIPTTSLYLSIIYFRIPQLQLSTRK